MTATPTMPAAAQVEAAPPSLALAGVRIRLFDPPPGVRFGPWVCIEDLMRAVGANTRHDTEIISGIQKSEPAKMMTLRENGQFIHAADRVVALRHVTGLFNGGAFSDTFARRVLTDLMRQPGLMQ